MKKIILSLLLSISFGISNAQTDLFSPIMVAGEGTEYKTDKLTHFYVLDTIREHLYGNFYWDFRVMEKSYLSLEQSQILNLNDSLNTRLKKNDISIWAKQPNPPSYTKTDVGLSNVDNTSDLSKPISTAVQNALNAKLSTEVDGSVTNELQTLSKVGDNLTISNGNTIALGIPIVKRQESYSGTTNASGQYTVTFSTAFLTAPNIQANIIGAPDNQNIRITSVGTTGFTVTVRNRVDVVGLLPTWTNVNGALVDVVVTQK